MAIVKKNFKGIFLCVSLVAVICFAALLVRPGYASLNADSIKPLQGPWLAQFEGQNMRITFVSAPTHLAGDLGKTSSLNLLEVGQAGIVVSFRPQRTVFFPYSQIVSIEPIYRNN